MEFYLGQPPDKNPSRLIPRILSVFGAIHAFVATRPQAHNYNGLDEPIDAINAGTATGYEGTNNFVFSYGWVNGVQTATVAFAVPESPSLVLPSIGGG